MLDLLCGIPMHPSRPHQIWLNRAFRSDPLWWRMFVADWNGVSYLLPPLYLPQHKMVSDTSGSWGCGAYHGTRWFQLQWDHRAIGFTMMVKELLPIVLATSIWGPMWESHRVICYCDNQAVVAALRSRSSRDSHIMHMLRTLALIEAVHNFSLAPQYITTKANYLGDDLSRNRLFSFLTKVPQAKSKPTPLPQQLLELLLDQTIDWTLPCCLQLFNSTSGRVWLPPQDEPMTWP